MNTSPLNPTTKILSSTISILAETSDRPPTLLCHGLDTLGIPHFWLSTPDTIIEFTESNHLTVCAAMINLGSEDFWRGMERIDDALFSFIHAQPDDRTPLYDFYLDWLIHLDYLLFGRSDEELLLDSEYQRLVLNA